MKLISRLQRLETTAQRTIPNGRRPELLAAILAKLDAIHRGEVLPPADWSTASPEVKEHRRRLLSRLMENDR